MDLTTPATAVLPTLRARVLMVLARADAGLTGRRIAALAERSVAGVAKVLEALVNGGLVHRIEAGPAYLYTLNRMHLAAPAVELLAVMRDELIKKVTKQIEAFDRPPLGAVLFGSAVRGDGDEDSDIDLLLIRTRGVDDEDETWISDVEALGGSVLAWTGNRLDVIQFEADEIITPSPSRRVLLDRVAAEGVLLAGVHPRDLTRGDRVVRRR